MNELFSSVSFKLYFFENTKNEDDFFMRMPHLPHYSLLQPIGLQYSLYCQCMCMKVKNFDKNLKSGTNIVTPLQKVKLAEYVCSCILAIAQ